MYRFLFFVYLLLFTCSFAEEDPSTFENVNVITGDFYFSQKLTTVQGALPIHLIRSYSTSGSKTPRIKSSEADSNRENYGWSFSGGNVLFPHLRLTLVRINDNQMNLACPEPNGRMVEYVVRFLKKKKEEEIGKAYTNTFQISGSFSARNDPRNNLIKVNLKEGITTIFLPDGGKRIYQRNQEKKGQKPKEEDFFIYHLQKEILPNGQLYRYYYQNNHLRRIESLNPSGTQIYAWVNFEVLNEKPLQLQAITSDQKVLNFYCAYLENKNYLTKIESSCHPTIETPYIPGRKGKNPKIVSLIIEKKENFKVHYFNPPNQKMESYWAKRPKKAPLEIDKIESIERPVGPNGEMQTVARFIYQEGLTLVRDSKGILTKFFHDSEKLVRIEYYDEKEKLHSLQKFFWEKNKLVCKALFNEKNEVFFARTFQYDPWGNVLEEAFWGYITGRPTSPLTIDAKGNPQGGEVYRRKLFYPSPLDLPSEEQEEEGLSYKYIYQGNTELITHKYTYGEGALLKREFKEYDENNLLIYEAIDNGRTELKEDLSGVTYSQFTRYRRNPDSGLITLITKGYTSSTSQEEVVLGKTYLTYSPNLLVTEEAVYDQNNDYRYSLYTTYNHHGLVTSKTTPSGKKSFCEYDKWDRPILQKEVGSPIKEYEYDGAGRVSIQKEEGKVLASFSYDSKGNLLSRTDHRGNICKYEYDCFSNCTQVIYPETLDEKGKLYSPKVKFEYDPQKNLIKTIQPKGEITQTWYNSLRKPLKIKHPDRTETHHYYDSLGNLTTTLYPDETEIHYELDALKRITVKETVGRSQLLSMEYWDYDSFNLLFHRDANQNQTLYSYDGFGRKIKEASQEREVFFFYDSLGFLEKTQTPSYSSIQKWDVEGKVLEQWKEDEAGNKKDFLSFSYDEENRKTSITKKTSQGEATDFIVYDFKNRILKHIDPLGSITEWIYTDDFFNGIHTVFQKTSIDPLGNTTLETEDTQGRLACLEKFDKDGNLLFQETYYYDPSGNRTKRVSCSFKDQSMNKELITTWSYDSMGRVVEEIEDQVKKQTYEYDPRGRINKKIFPDETSLEYTYDGMNRLIELKSSDQTVHYKYFYKQGQSPIKVLDKIANLTFERNYNTFEELIWEKLPSGAEFSWEYDSSGRKISYTLPDHSSVRYMYQGMYLKAIQRYGPKQDFLYEHIYDSYNINGHVEKETTLQLEIIETEHDLLERPLFQSSRWLQQKIAYGASGLITSWQSSLFEKQDYCYDGLNQLTHDGKHEYHFDALGNPEEYEIGFCNQLQKTPKEAFSYDAKGNPISRETYEKKVHYTYDILGRLTSLHYPEEDRVVSFQYDPFARLYAKAEYQKTSAGWSPKKIYSYLHDQEKEVGRLDEEGHLLEFRVLGLGIKEDIGASVALELSEKVYVPLHDFKGNIIAIVNPKGKIEEKYSLDVFGNETIKSSPKCPWRFHSKRHEEHLVFFGARFYDPSIKRWLTPDPAGFTEGPNLYLFVLNNPVNRLDAFGLFSEHPFEPYPNYGKAVYIPIPTTYSNRAPMPEIFACKGLINGVPVDWVVSCSSWHELSFTPEEKASGYANVLDHMADFVPSQGGKVGLITIMNGIGVSLENFQNIVYSTKEKAPEIPLIIGLYNTDLGLVKNLWESTKEVIGIETEMAIKTRQWLVTTSEFLCKINPETSMIHVIHSRAGGINKVAIQGMTPEQKETFRNFTRIIALAPSAPIPSSFALEVFNLYSEHDPVTKVLSYHYSNNPDYNIDYVKSNLSSSGRIFNKISYPAFGIMGEPVKFLINLPEHNFLSESLSDNLSIRINKIRREKGLYSK